MNIAVLGAGCGGQAIAGYMASQGHEVNLYNRSQERLLPLYKKRQIQLVGKVQETGKLANITSDIEEAIEGCELIMVVTTATGHKEVAQASAPYLKDGQTIILNPGRTFGILEYINTLLDYGCKADVDVAEANTLIYATRLLEPSISNIKGIKSRVAFSTIPKHRTTDVLEKISETYSQFYPKGSFLSTSMGNIGTVFHPTITLLNRERIKKGESFDFYTEGATQEAIAYMRAIDKERRAISRALGSEVPSIEEWLCNRYGLDPKENLQELLRNNPVYQSIPAPTTLDNRYLTEDVPTGLVPISEMGKALGISTPAIDRLIESAIEELGERVIKSGRTLDSLGLIANRIHEDIDRINNAKSIQELRKERERRQVA